MLRNLDEELVEDREFRIGGELFEFVYPHWEIGAKMFDDDLTPAEPNGDGQPGVLVGWRTRSWRSSGSRCS